jgi:hypothetical protein
MGRLLLVVSGFWLGLLAASWVMATLSFRTVDRVLGPEARPEMASRLAALPEPERRVVLRHLASEINRGRFRTWAIAQLVLGALALGAAWRGDGPTRLLVGAAFLLVLFQLLVLTPAIAAVGRSIDFIPRPLPADVGRRFGMLHAGYVGADFVKAILVALAAWTVARRP